MVDTHLRRRELLGKVALLGAGTLLAACTPVAAPGAAIPTEPPSTQPGPAAATRITNTAPSGNHPAPVTVTYGAADEATLNPLLMMFSGPNDLMFESLVKPDPKLGTPIPGLATGWDATPDGLTWTFHIRPQVQWSDGQPFTSEDVRFTFDTVRDPKTQTPYRSRLANVASFDAPDPATFRVQLQRADCPFLSLAMQIPIVPQHSLSGSTDINSDPFNTSRPVGTGPFMFKEWQRGDHLTLVANPNHWQGRPKIDQWIRGSAGDRNVLLAKLKTGEIDYASVPPDAFDEVTAQSNLNVVSVPSPILITYIAYNLDNPLFQDKRVRQALTHAIDRQSLVATQLSGQGHVLNSSISPVSWAYTSEVPVFDHNPDRARALLQDAGWSPGAEGMLQKDGTRFSFTLLTNSGNPLRAAIQVIAQAAWRQIGVDANLLILETNAFNTKWQTPGKRDFDAIVAGGGAGVTIDPDQTSLWASSEYPDGGNFVHYTNPAVDQALQQGRTAAGCDSAARKPFYAQFQQLIADDQPFTFLYAANSILAYNKRLQNVQASSWIGSAPYVGWSAKGWTVSS
jgi:peptide/nickel transport system substrate-binding protein